MGKVMNGSNAVDFNAVKILIEDYQRCFSLRSNYETLKNLVENYKSSSIYIESLHRQAKRFSIVKGLIEDYKKTALSLKAQRYDLFRELKLKLSEDELSNITADIFNPQKSPFGKSILIRLLRKTGKKEVASMIEQVREENIVVKREQSGDNSRIDIRIVTKNFSDENVVIDLEMKVRSGSETSHRSGKPQTIREWDGLIKFANIRGISKKNVVAYFITPYGTKAKSKDFLNLSRYELNQIIWEELDCMKEYATINKDGISALRHFFGSSWLF